MTIKQAIIKGRIRAFVILMAMLYGVFSVISWDINPGDWHIVARIVFCIIALAFLNKVINTKLDDRGNIVK